MGEVLTFDNSVLRYRNLAEERAEKGDFLGALSFLFSAKSIAKSHEVIMDIAYIYSDMSLFELSNKYWFLYLDVAPKEKQAIAYEELAINYFYMDNYWASSYYFHKKLDVDGYITKEGLDKEIIDFFSGEEMKKSAYRLVYPFDRVDYSRDEKIAKHFLAIGAFEEAKKPLQSIPPEFRSIDASGELALANYMVENLDEAEKVCRDSLKNHGENVTAYCHLSTVYNMRKDEENAEFYYQKALSVRKGEKGEEYNLATCAIERNDHVNANLSLKQILEDRPYEATMRFFYAISFLNLGKYERALDEFKTSYRINPDDRVVYYYLKSTEALLSGDKTLERYLPVKYEKELPQQVEKEYCELLKKLTAEPLKMEFYIKDKRVRQAIEWGIFCGSEQAPKDAVFALSNAYGKYAKELIRKTLLDPEIKEEIKRVLIYVSIVSGVKEKFGVTVGSFYLKIKPKKLKCERADDGAIYFSAYALCMARMVFFEAENLDRIGKEIDKIYLKLSKVISEAEVSNEELAALLVSECEFKWIKKDNDVMKLFEITAEKLKKLKAIYRGENYD